MLKVAGPLIWTVIIANSVIAVCFVGLFILSLRLFQTVHGSFRVAVVGISGLSALVALEQLVEIGGLHSTPNALLLATKCLFAVVTLFTTGFFIKNRPIRALAEEVRASREAKSKLERSADERAVELERRIGERTTELRELDERFERVSAATDLGVWNCDLPFSDLNWNVKTKEHFFMKPDHKVTIEDFYRHIVPADRERTKEAIETSIRNRESYDIEYRTFDPDANAPSEMGSYKWIRAIGWADGKPGQAPDRFDGITLDLTDQKRVSDDLQRSEERFRLMADHMPQIVWMSDPNGLITYASRGWFEYTGFNWEATRGEGWASALHADDLAPTIELWTRSLREGTIIVTHYRVRRFDGVYRYHLVKGVPVKDDRGQVVYWLGMITDVHDFKLTEVKLHEAVRARDEFLSIASHELKTPLTSLKLQSQIMQRGIQKNGESAYQKPQVERLISQVDKQVNRLTRLVDDMLDISRIRSEKMAYEFLAGSLVDVIRESIDRLRPQFIAAGASEPVIETAAPIVAWFDALRMEQVVTNLLTNALKYGRGQPISVSLTRQNEFAVIAVRDHGIGISADAKEKIFNRFERAIDANEVSGLGLGLFIASEIVKAHGGRIGVESEVGRGSTFFVELPFGERGP